jgi:hypothetical protein
MVQIGTAFALVEDCEKANFVGCGEITTEVRMEFRRSWRESNRKWFLSFKLRVEKVRKICTR